MKIIAFCFFLLIFNLGHSQFLFPEKFYGCADSTFSIENDSILARTNVPIFIKTIFSNQSEKIKAKIKGEITLQILVDLDGKPCLISIENKTNVRTKSLHLKELVDGTKWEAPWKKVCAIVVLTINKEKHVHYTRMGLNGNTGWRELFDISKTPMVTEPK